MINILIIDDNYKFVETLFNELQEDTIQKYNIVKICTDTTNIIDYILKDIVDVILLNLNMPNIDGFQILDIINKNNIKSKVIVMSGDTNCILRLIKEKYTETIFKLFIKPFNVEDLKNDLNMIYYEINAIKKGKNIENILNIFNFNKTSIGYEYILQSLNICIKYKYKRIPNMQFLCDKISKENHFGSSNNIKWNIYKAIDNMQKNTEKDIINKYFQFSPSAKNFLNKILAIYFSD